MDAALKKKERERETNPTPNMTMVSVLPTSQGHSWNEMFIKEGREGGGREREREREELLLWLSGLRTQLVSIHNNAGLDPCPCSVG